MVKLAEGKVCHGVTSSFLVVCQRFLICDGETHATFPFSIP